MPETVSEDVIRIGSRRGPLAEASVVAAAEVSGWREGSERAGMRWLRPLEPRPVEVRDSSADLVAIEDMSDPQTWSAEGNTPASCHRTMPIAFLVECKAEKPSKCVVSVLNLQGDTGDIGGRAIQAAASYIHLPSGRRNGPFH